MNWPLLNRLFGWEYAHLQNTATEIVRRVHLTRSGERYIRYFGDHLVFIDRSDCPWRVIDLTAPRALSIVAIKDISTGGRHAA